MTTPAQLAQKIDLLPHWHVGDTVRDNLEYNLDRFEIERRIAELSQPIPGLNRIVIYYPISEYKHRVEYASAEPISPLQVLASINELYAQPITRANVDAIAEILGEPSEEPFDDTVLGLDPDHGHFEGLERYQDGWAVRLGS